MLFQFFRLLSVFFYDLACYDTTILQIHMNKQRNEEYVQELKPIVNYSINWGNYQVLLFILKCPYSIYTNKQNLNTLQSTRPKIRALSPVCGIITYYASIIQVLLLLIF